MAAVWAAQAQPSVGPGEQSRVLPCLLLRLARSSATATATPVSLRGRKTPGVLQNASMTQAGGSGTGEQS